jgi:hypothetical protein
MYTTSPLTPLGSAEKLVGDKNAAYKSIRVNGPSKSNNASPVAAAGAGLLSSSGRVAISGQTGALTSKFTCQNTNGQAITSANQNTRSLPNDGGKAALTPSNHQAQKVDPTLPKINIVTDPKQLPTPTYQSQIIPQRDFSQAPHKFPPKKVDSRLEAKGEAPRGLPMAPNTNAIPQFVGTSYAHLPANRVIIPAGQLPARATIPKAYPTLSNELFTGVNLLHNRSANGKILGQAAQRFISEAHVPYLPPEEPVGPDNPYVAINETWTKCWDHEAGAVYYYNNINGEATWVPPIL